MVRAGIVEVHGELDESQAEDRRVELQVALRITGDGGDVMNPGNGRCRHGALSDTVAPLSRNCRRELHEASCLVTNRFLHGLRLLTAIANRTFAIELASHVDRGSHKSNPPADTVINGSARARAAVPRSRGAHASR